jgi:hypothetical protein
MPLLSHANGSPLTREGHTSFSQLVRAHHRWAKQLHGRNRIDEQTLEQYQTALADFEGTAGSIVDAYWCLEEASAVALTAREPEQQATAGLLGRLVGRAPEPELRLHRVTDWVTAQAPPLADLLHSCDILAIKAGEGLEGTARRVAMQWVLAVETHVLGFVERSHPDRVDLKELQAFVASERAELNQIEKYINGSGERAARIYFIQGMLLGIFPLIAVGFLAAFLLSLFDALDVHNDGLRAFYGCATAGAAGAIVSVLSRMGSRKDNFAIDHEIPRRGLYLLGSYRPIVGAIFGVAMYFLVSTPLLQIEQRTKTFAFYVTVAFLSGFSERWTRVILDGAQSVIGGKAGKPEITTDDVPAPARNGQAPQTALIVPGPASGGV